MTDLPTHLTEIRSAAALIADAVRRTPLLATDLSPDLLVKPESLQVTGAFKARGACHAIRRLRERQPGVSGVVAVSSGNHAQAVAWAAAAAGLRARVVIPAGGNPRKVEAARAFGADVVSEGVTFANREEVASDIIAATGWPLVHPFDDWDVIHGAGTAALEVMEEAGQLAVVAVPVGGGGLLAGTALATKALRPAVRVVGVEPELADDARRSLKAGKLRRLEATPATMADGVRVLGLGRRNFEVIVERGLVDDIVTVSEDEIALATATAWSRLRLAVEPTGALPLAAFLAGRLGPGPAAIVISGGNFDPAVMAPILSGPDRYSGDVTSTA
jgi:threonine dehydratase